MITIPIVSLIGGIALAVFSIYDLTKTKEKKSGSWMITAVISLGLLSFSALGFYGEGSKSGTLKTMRQRLNEPIVFEAQLHGYKIVGKHMEEYGSSDDTLYFIDIRDILTNKKTLMHVKISPELYEKVKMKRLKSATALIIP